jgi:hypothetical protein
VTYYLSCLGIADLGVTCASAAATPASAATINHHYCHIFQSGFSLTGFGCRRHGHAISKEKEICVLCDLLRDVHSACVIIS